MKRKRPFENVVLHEVEKIAETESLIAREEEEPCDV